MATEWKVIRVSSEVVDGLQAVRASLWKAHENAQVDGVVSRVGTITDNAVVEYLLKHYNGHRERRARSRKNVTAKRKQRCVATTGLNGVATSDSPSDS